MANKLVNKKDYNISIVTISFNQADYLEECLLSVLNQDYKNIEYIVVDAGSTDGSREIIDKYRHRISKIIFEKDEGPADGLNKGFKSATGDIYLYLNSDDYLMPGALRVIVNEFANRDIDILFGNALMVNKKGEKIKKLYSTPWNTNAFIFGECPIVQPATSFKSSIYTQTTGFNISNRTCWDGELIADMSLLSSRMGHVNKLLAGFRLYDDSISGSGRKYQEYITTRNEYIKKLNPTISTQNYISTLFRTYYRARKVIYRLQNLLSMSE